MCFAGLITRGSNETMEIMVGTGRLRERFNFPARPTSGTVKHRGTSDFNARVHYRRGVSVTSRRFITDRGIASFTSPRKCEIIDLLLLPVSEFATDKRERERERPMQREFRNVERVPE